MTRLSVCIPAAGSQQQARDLRVHRPRHSEGIGINIFDGVCITYYTPLRHGTAVHTQASIEYTCKRMLRMCHVCVSKSVSGHSHVASYIRGVCVARTRSSALTRSCLLSVGSDFAHSPAPPLRPQSPRIGFWRRGLRKIWASAGKARRRVYCTGLRASWLELAYGRPFCASETEPL
jgi:hypothetical protein